MICILCKEEKSCEHIFLKVSDKFLIYNELASPAAAKTALLML